LWWALVVLWLWLLPAAPELVGQTVARWVGGSGNWSDTNHWDIGKVPNNAGATTYVAVVDLAGDNPTVSVGAAITISGLVNSETVRVDTSGTLTISGSVTNRGSLVAAAGALRLNSPTVDNSGATIAGEGAAVTITGSTLSGGTLRVSNAAASFVRFSGDVTLNGVTWDDAGDGEFQIYNTTARLLGDYATHLPAGCRLVVSSQGTHSAVQWTMLAGVFTNDGTIELRHGGSGWTGYPRLHWEGSGTLAGGGDVFMTGAGDNNLITGTTNVTLTIGLDQRVHGRGDIQLPVVNQGRLEANLSGKQLRVGGLLANSGVAQALNGGTLLLAGGVTDTGLLGGQPSGNLTLNQSVSLHANLIAPSNSVVRVATATVALGGNRLAAEGGQVVISDTILSNGTLGVSDNPASLVRFSGDVTLNNVTWDDLGQGEFQIYNTTARLLGDFANQLPSLCTLIVYSQGTHGAVQWTMPSGAFTNNGTIELRHGGSGWTGYPRLYWEGSGTLAGTGEVFMSGAGDNILITGNTNVTLTIGADQWVHGRGDIQLPVVNQGRLEADLSGKQLRVGGLLVNSGIARALNGGTLLLAGGVTDTGVLGGQPSGNLTLNQAVSLHADLVAPSNSVVRLATTTTALNGNRLAAEGGQVVISDSTLSNGTLVVSDNPASLVRFSGDVTLNSVTWDDPGQGEFQVYNTTARLLGDYANQLPSICTLIVYSQGTHSAVQWTMPSGAFTNNGTIELRHGGGGWQGYPRLHWEGSGTLEGNGELILSGAGDNNLITGAPGTVLTIGRNWVHGRGDFQVDVVNDGIVEADLSGKTLRFSRHVQNHGRLQCLVGASLVFAGGLTDTGVLAIDPGGNLTLNEAVSLHTDLIAPSNSVVRITTATVAPGGNRIAAEGGQVLITDSTITNAVLRVSDSPVSLVRFYGDVTLLNVTWDDPGDGQFQIYNTTARLLGDYARQLPSGYTLVVNSQSTHSAVQWNLPSGVFTNNGTIELRHGGGGWQGYPRLWWEGSGTLTGNGTVFMSGAGDYILITGATGATLTIGPDQFLHGRGEVQVDVVNQGTIEADLAGKPLRFAGRVTNYGIMRALSGCNLVMWKDLENDGRLIAKGGTIEVDGRINLSATGTLETEAPGTIRIGRHLLTAVGNQSAVTTTARLVLDGGGVPSPDLYGNPFFIDAEDFNYDRGLHQAVSDVMPYLGGAYQGRGGRDRTDYHQTDNRVDSDLYRSGEGPAINVNIYALGERYRGVYDATNNFKVGWNEAGDWYNYSRVYPAPAQPWYFFARLASGGAANAIQVDEMVGDVSTPTQVTNKIGEARGPATGDYNRFTFVPLRDASSNLVELAWTGPKTFRVTILSGGNEDMDYFVLAPAASSGPAQLLEVMGEDLGPIGTAFSNSVAVGSLTLAANSQVRLVDQVDNAPGGAPEALYVNTLVVPAGTTLDLNGLTLYAIDVQVAGTVVGGTVQKVQPAPPLLAIRPLGSSVEISWPTAAGRFNLDETDALNAPIQWRTVTNPPVVVVGASNTVTPTASGKTRSYRLRSN
jgi:adhesin HecA-like repeat protein